MAIIDVVGSKWVKWAWRKTCLSCFSSLLKITSFPVSSYLLPESLPNSVLAISFLYVDHLQAPVCFCPNSQLPHITSALRNVSILSCRSVSLTLTSKHFMRLLFFKAFLKCPFFCKSSHFINQSSLWFVIFVSSVLEIELGTSCVFRQALCHIHIPLLLDIFFSSSL